METNDERNRLYLRPSNDKSFDIVQDQTRDLFAFPPAAILHGNKIYLFSEALRRVYVLPSEPFLDLISGTGQAASDVLDQGIPIRSKSWKAFFRCTRNGAKVQDTEEISQSDYIEMIRNLLQTT